jgi:hypothetical protein
MSADKMSGDKMSVDKMSADKMSEEKMLKSYVMIIQILERRAGPLDVSVEGDVTVGGKNVGKKQQQIKSHCHHLAITIATILSFEGLIHNTLPTVQPRKSVVSFPHARMWL